MSRRKILPRGPSSLIEKATYTSKVVGPTGVDKLDRFS